MSPSLIVRVVLALCALLVGLPVAGASATTFEPNRFDDPVKGGTSCGPPAAANGCSLRGAVEAAKAGDTVDLSAGTYLLEQGALEPEEALTILGDGPGATTIEQTGLDRVIDAQFGGAFTMSGVTITGGLLIGGEGKDGELAGEKGENGGSAYGAGIAGGAAPLTLTDVVVIGNTALGGDGGNGAAGSVGGEGGRGGSANGAGISAGNPTVLTRVAVLENLSAGGEGGKGGGPEGIADSGGKGGAGGGAVGTGIAAGGATIAIVDSTIAGNVAIVGAAGDGGNGGVLAGAPGDGGQGEAADGAGFFANGVVKMTNVTIAGNTAEGGIAGDGGDAHATLGEVQGGDSGAAFGGLGGGVAFFNGASGQLASVTLAGNVSTPPTAGTPGAGSEGGPAGEAGPLFAAGGGNAYVANAEFAARDTIIADGTASAGKENCAFSSGGMIESLGHNLESGEECIATHAGGDLSNTPTGLGPLASNGGPTQTMALLAGSAAINAGEPSCVDAEGEPLATDQRGEPRLSPCDIGAYEVQPEPPAEPISQPVTPKLKKLKVSPSKVRKGKRATISFDLDIAARVSFKLERKLPGARVGGKCVKRTRKLAKKKRCNRFVRVKKGAPPAFDAKAGANKRKWKPSRRLRVGGYRLAATPKGGKTKRAGFALLNPKRR